MIEVVLTSLHKLLDMLGAERFRDDQRKDFALSSILAATSETKLYLKRKKRDQRIEEQLVRLWAAAAVPLRHYDRDLAERCTMKSEYWLNPANYSDADIKKFRIGIDQVYKEAKRLL